MNQNGYIGRKMRLPRLKEQPAIIIAAFGSSRRGKAALDLFDASLKAAFPDHEIFWAYTSEIIRRKTGTPGLHETLAMVEAQGYRKAVVQPLHIFAGTEYQQLSETCSYFPGLRTVVGETLCHRWDFIKEVLAIVCNEFLSEEEGLNLLALHGTPIAADPVNTIYLGLEHLLADQYSNVLMASIEGIPDQDSVLKRIARQKLAERYRKIRIVPMMYLAGLHVEDDLMGDEESWRSALVEMGFEVDCPQISHDSETYFKGLAFYPECSEFFLERIQRALQLITYF